MLKLYITRIMIRLLFTIHRLQPFHAFSNIMDLIEANESIYQNVQYFVLSVFLNFNAVRYSLHECSETIL